MPMSINLSHPTIIIRYKCMDQYFLCSISIIDVNKEYLFRKKNQNFIETLIYNYHFKFWPNYSCCLNIFGVYTVYIF